MGSVRRGVAFRFHVYERLEKLARETGRNFSDLVNEALCLYLSRDLSPEERERFKLVKEKNDLQRENDELHRDLKAILKHGAYLHDAVIDIALGRRRRTSSDGERLGLLQRPGKEKELEIVLRIMAQREKNTQRLVEIEDVLLPEEKFDLEDGGCP